MFFPLKNCIVREGLVFGATVNLFMSRPENKASESWNDLIFQRGF